MKITQIPISVPLISAEYFITLELSWINQSALKCHLQINGMEILPFLISFNKAVVATSVAMIMTTTTIMMMMTAGVVQE